MQHKNANMYVAQKWMKNYQSISMENKSFYRSYCVHFISSDTSAND